MNHTAATHQFLPWLRRGIATEITRADGDGAVGPRAEIPVTVFLDVGEAQPRHVTVNLPLYGPGEVAGIDPRVVIRTYPRRDVFDAEANYFPAIEFDQPDFPWRYTPARADASDRLRPWLVLIALTADEIVGGATAPADSRGRLPSITVRSADYLPRLDQSWAWAHVQVTEGNGTGEESVADVIAAEPQRVLSRLLCPRRLTPRTAYTAYLVPAFERGRLAGLNHDIPQNLDAMVPAWNDGDADIELPVYYEWCFQAGLAGDFEALVRQLLPPKRLPQSVGQRDIDMSHPGAGLPAVSTQPLSVEGALRLPGGAGRPWDPAEQAAFQSQLRERLNRPAVLLEREDADPVVAPPLYGRWHAAQDRLQPGGPSSWFHELNADPRLRVAAGLGTQVVQQQQEQLMASAWDQVEGVRALNEKLRQTQLAREVAQRTRARHLETLDDETALLVTVPVHSRVRASPQTVQAILNRSPIAAGALEGQLRRVSRPLGPIGKRQGRPRRPRQTTMLERMNQGKLSPAPRPAVPEGMPTPPLLGAGWAPGWATPSRLSWLRWLPIVLGILAALLGLLTVALYARSTVVATALALLCVACLIGAYVVRRWHRWLVLRTGLRDGTLTGAVWRRRPRTILSSISHALGAVPPIGHALGAVPPISGPGGDDQTPEELRIALAAFFDQVSALPPEEQQPLRADIRGLRQTMEAALDPEASLVRPLRRRVDLPPEAAWQPDDPLEPVMAAPEFDRPMAEALRELSQEWLLPGVGQIPANSVALLESNQRFIESYMAGLNHEMASELLWREYPTDQRGSYFRQFWDVRDHVDASGAAADPDALKDIKPLVDWGNNSLGSNGTRAAVPDRRQLVLLIRGEVLRRYPNTVIYANNAVLNEEDKRILGDERHYPIFRGTLEPDMTFLGFDLPPAGPQGWFFVLQEPPTEPRFGLDEVGERVEPLTDWAHLSWGHVVADPQELEHLIYIDLAAELHHATNLQPADLQWHVEATRSSHIAVITLQSPFRVAIHESDMLPTPGG